MNKNVKTLIGSVKTDVSGKWMSMDNVHILSELIVKECAYFLKDTMDDHFTAEQLEEYFGIE